MKTPLRLCGYCKTWNSKPCGEQCHLQSTDPTQSILQEKERTCEWVQDGDDEYSYIPACDKSWVIPMELAGGPKENGDIYCRSCGGKIVCKKEETIMSDKEQAVIEGEFKLPRVDRFSSVCDGVQPWLLMFRLNWRPIPTYYQKLKRVYVASIIARNLKESRQ